MLATALWRLRNGLGQCRAGRGRLDDLVHDANLDGPRQTTGEPVVLRRQLLLHGRALGIGHFSQPPATSSTCTGGVLNSFSESRNPFAICRFASYSGKTWTCG